MKYIIIFILIVILGLIGYGYFLKDSGDFQGELLIGSGVLLIAFVLMPLFIFHRYKNKDLSKFRLNNEGLQKSKEEEDL